MNLENLTEMMSAIVSAIAIIVTCVHFNRSLLREKRRETIAAYGKLQIDVLDKINAYRPTQIKEIVTDTSSEEYKLLSSYLAKIEHFCAGLTIGLYDYKTFYKLSKGYFDSDRGILKPRILPIIEKKSKHSNMNYFENIFKTWETIDKLKKEAK